MMMVKDRFGGRNKRLCVAYSEIVVKNVDATNYTWHQSLDDCRATRDVFKQIKDMPMKNIKADSVQIPIPEEHYEHIFTSIEIKKRKTAKSKGNTLIKE
jgi:hypothetical protein